MEQYKIFVRELLPKIIAESMIKTICSDPSFAADLTKQYLEADEVGKSDIVAFYNSDGPRMISETHLRDTENIPTSDDILDSIGGVSRSLANKVYDVLVSEAGLLEGRRSHFIHFVTFSITVSSAILHEYKITGCLEGRGAKLIIRPARISGGIFGPQFKVDCHPEDRSEKNDKIIENVNKLLAELS